MAQAARPLRPARVAAPTPHLRAVPPAAPPAPPSAQVIRRRRLVALAGLVALLVLPLAWLSISGSPATDTGRITAMLEQGVSDPARLCDHLSTGMLQAVGGHGACVKASPERGPGGTVHDVHVSGATATAIVSRNDGDESVRLVRQDGAWKVDDVH